MRANNNMMAKRLMIPASTFTTQEMSAASHLGNGYEMWDEAGALFAGPFTLGFDYHTTQEYASVKAYVWWQVYSAWSNNDYSAGAPDIGFFALMQNLHLTPEEDEKMYPVNFPELKIGDAVPGRLAAASWGNGIELGYPLPKVAAVKNNRIDWTFFDEDFYDARMAMPGKYPNTQFALGTQKLDTVVVDPVKVGSWGAGTISILEAKMYRTPLKLLAKNNAGFYLENDVAFENLPCRFAGDSLGFVITFGRTNGFIGWGPGLEGDLPFATLAPDNMTMDDIIFMGLELEIIS